MTKSEGEKAEKAGGRTSRGVTGPEEVWIFDSPWRIEHPTHRCSQSPPQTINNNDNDCCDNWENQEAVIDWKIIL